VFKVRAVSDIISLSLRHVITEA